MAKATTTKTTKSRLVVSKRTSIGSGSPTNKSKRRAFKPYRGQGR
jgi:hypothetical protein